MEHPYQYILGLKNWARSFGLTLVAGFKDTVLLNFRWEQGFPGFLKAMKMVRPQLETLRNFAGGRMDPGNTPLVCSRYPILAEHQPRRNKMSPRI